MAAPIACAGRYDPGLNTLSLIWSASLTNRSVFPCASAAHLTTVDKPDCTSLFCVLYGYPEAASQVQGLDVRIHPSILRWQGGRDSWRLNYEEFVALLFVTGVCALAYQPM